LPDLQTLVGFGTLALDPHLPGTQKLFQCAVRQLRKPALEPSVQPDIVLVFAYRQGLNRRHRQLSFPFIGAPPFASKSWFENRQNANKFI
jgi:hypothetical protein